MDKPFDQNRLDRSFTLAVGLFSTTLALLFFLQSALFTLQSVQLTGAVYLTEAELLSIAGIPYGESVFNIDLRQATERLMAHPRIDRAQVRRKLPSSLEIEIVERTPVAILPYSDGFAAIDHQGRVLMISDQLRLPYPLLTGFDAPESTGIYPGAQLQLLPLHETLAVASALGPDLIAWVSEVQVATSGISLLTRDGVVVRLGDTTQLSEKLQTLRALRTSLANDERRLELIDLRVPRTPVLR